jgi:hypothetical protein
VIVLQRARNPGRAETFSFLLDESLNNITIYITGKSLTFTLKNPAGKNLKHYWIVPHLHPEEPCR